MLRLAILMVAFFCSFQLNAQSKYWIFLNEKDTTGFNPHRFFDPKAIERRERNGLPLNDYSDVPVAQKYIDGLESVSSGVTYASRWFNAVCLFASDEQLAIILTLPFVDHAEAVVPGHFVVAETDTLEAVADSWLREKQLEIMQGDMFQHAGINGKGVRIAIFDGGFPGVDVLPCFNHVRDSGRIIKTWDFTRGKENVYGFNSHGTTVMCCIAGIDSLGKPFGLATGAEFLLARTEVNAEPFSEEENWVAALEWADQNGADIINSSLGYTYHRYFPFQMDGKTSFVTRGADMAASKGILVVNAAGNDGDNSWKIVGAPADAEGVLSVGGVDPYSAIHIGFGSMGPTADGRLKPNVSAAAQVFAYGKNRPGMHYGTSFASPLTAGFAACVLQLQPELTTIELFGTMQKCSHLYPYYDYMHGYGIPQASWFFESTSDTTSTQINIVERKGMIEVNVSPVTDRVDGFGYCYIHLSDDQGQLVWYKVLRVEQEKVFEALKVGFSQGEILRVHYLNQTKEYSF